LNGYKSKSSSLLGGFCDEIKGGVYLKRGIGFAENFVLENPASLYPAFYRLLI